MTVVASLISCGHTHTSSRLQSNNKKSDIGQRARCRSSLTPCLQDRLRALFFLAPVSVGPVGTWTFWPLEQGSAEIIEVARLRGAGVGGPGGFTAAGGGGRRGATGAVHRQGG